MRQGPLEEWGSGITAPGQRINHGGARWGESGDMVRSGNRDAAMMSSSTSATQPHHFNFRLQGTIWCVSCVTVIFST